MRYQYLLIDNDNTIMDFNAAEAKALIDVLQNHGLPTDDATVTEPADGETVQDTTAADSTETAGN